MTNQQITILYIDDNPTNRYVVQRLLQNAGFRVAEASSGETGLQAIARQPPDLIILDVHLPDLNGFEVCQRIKDNPATHSIPVLHLSAAYVKSQDRAQGLEMGADAYLVQPVEPVELLATVRALLRLRAAEKTAQQQARDWQTTFDAMRDGICLLDENGRVRRCNRAIETLLKQPCAALRDRHYHDLVPLHTDPTAADLSPEALRDRLCLDRLRQTRQRQSIEVPLQLDGDRTAADRWVAITLDPIFDEADILTGAVYVVTDITARKRAEAERESLLLREQEALSASEAVNRMKDEFLATLSHELRSPLNAILGWTKLLQTRAFDPRFSLQALEVIERNTRAQTQLVEDLLDVSRIIQGKLRLNIVSVDLALVIESAIETLQPAAEAKQIAIKTQFESVGAIAGDPDRLQQIIWNLLSNAIKFTPPGGQVEIKLEQNDQGNDPVPCPTSSPEPTPPASPQPTSLIQISVSDTGKGIHPNFLPYVFDRFRQSDSSITRNYGGLGLGLSIVRHLVELHGGSARADSPGEGQGATFMIQLPSRAEPDRFPSLRSERPEAIAPHPAPPPSLDSLRVLVVDDEADTRHFLSTLLELHGATVVQADSAQTALQQIQLAPVDLVISDIGMPNEDGYSLIRQIRQLPNKPPPAIALTGYARSEDRDLALTAGFQLHLSKPVEPQSLVQAIARLTQHP